MSYPQQNITYPGTYTVNRMYGGNNSSGINTQPPIGTGYDAFQSASTVSYTNLNPSPSPMDQSKDNWNPRGQMKRGGGGWRGRGGRKPNPGPKKEFSCSNKHPVAALKTLRPNAQFAMVCSYSSSKGSALVYTVNIDGTVYQGEATSGQIARAIAATKALAGINANDHALVQKVADYEEQKQLVLDRISAWQETQAAKEKAKKMKEEQEQMREQKKQQKADKQAMILEQSNKKMKDNDGSPLDMGNMLKDLPLLQRKYGPDITCDVVECQEKSSLGTPQFSCEVIVQGTKFSAIASSKRSAKRNAIARAFDELEENPPPLVNDITKKRKVANRRNKHNSIEFKPIEAVEFQDKLAEKCWNFVSEQLTNLPAIMARRRNLVVIIKVQGAEELDNCEVVAFGNGTIPIKQEKMTGDGQIIEDATGESLALRAFRRYLLDNTELCFKNDSSSIFEKQRGGKIGLRAGITFYMYTNSAPVGDCRALHFDEKMETATDLNSTQDSTAPAESEVTEDTKMEADKDSASEVENKDPQKPRGRPGRRWKFFKQPRNTPAEDLGKLTFFKELPTKDCTLEITVLPTSDLGDGKLSPLPSPSDKLAVRQAVGVQGSMLSNLMNPVYLSKYLVGRSFHVEALNRALYERVKGAKQPEFLQVKWKVTKMAEPPCKFAFIWSKNRDFEVLYAIIGKKITVTEGTDANDTEKLIEGSQVSYYCTKNLYDSYYSLCKAFKKTASKYSVIKVSNTKYRQEKKAAIQHFKDSGFGEWAVKPTCPTF